MFFSVGRFSVNMWQPPFLSVLSGTDKDALQSIFRSLQNELGKMAKEIEDLKSMVKEQNR
jgi:Skp family chaperone for outer membrane proteins